jgi:hypothetical protein
MIKQKCKKQKGGRFPEWEIDYFNGNGQKMHHLYHIMINVALIIRGIRPTFLIQPVDYGDKKGGVIEHIKSVLAVDLEESPIKLFNIPQGILVVPKREVIGDEKYEWIKRMFVSHIQNPKDDVILGKLLGYPCANEVNDRHKKRVGLNLIVEGGLDIISMICTSREGIGKTKELFQYIIDFYEGKKRTTPIWSDLPDLKVNEQEYPSLASLGMGGKKKLQKKSKKRSQRLKKKSKKRHRKLKNNSNQIKELKLNIKYD